RRTPCMATRSATACIVVTSPTMSTAPDDRATCNASALSLPLDQLIQPVGTRPPPAATVAPLASRLPQSQCFRLHHMVREATPHVGPSSRCPSPADAHFASTWCTAAPSGISVALAKLLMVLIGSIYGVRAVRPTHPRVRRAQYPESVPSATSGRRSQETIWRS